MFYLFLLAHLVADFLLQPFWLVQRKRYWDGLLIHVGVVLLCMLALMLIEPGTRQLWPAMLVITAVHLAADRGKVRYGDRIPGPPIGPFLLDQLIHIATLALVLDAALPAAQVWQTDASAYAPLAIVACAFVAAACATPIAVMIWLDPAAQNTALSGQARVRSFVLAGGVLALTLMGGALALPATLLGLTFALRHPQSRHPLDRPTGLLTVLCVGASLGALLTVV